LLPVHHSASSPAPQSLCGLSVHQACGQGLRVTLLSCTTLAHLDAALAGLHPCARLPSRLSASTIRCGPGGTCYQTVGAGSTSQPRWTWLCSAARPRGPWPLLSPPALRLLRTQLQAVQRTFSRAPRHSLRACCGARAPVHLSAWRGLTVPPELVLDLLVNRMRGWLIQKWSGKEKLHESRFWVQNLLRPSCPRLGANPPWALAVHQKGVQESSTGRPIVPSLEARCLPALLSARRPALCQAAAPELLPVSGRIVRPGSHGKHSGGTAHDPSGGMTQRRR
jgi:hypothetical protein